MVEAFPHGNGDVNGVHVCFFVNKNLLVCQDERKCKACSTRSTQSMSGQAIFDPRDDSRWLQPGIRWHQKIMPVGTVDLLGGSRISFFSPVCIYLFQSIGTGILII